MLINTIDFYYFYLVSFPEYLITAVILLSKTTEQNGHWAVVQGLGVKMNGHTGIAGDGIVNDNGVWVMLLALVSGSCPCWFNGDSI